MTVHHQNPTLKKRAFVNADWAPIFVVGHPRSGTTLLASILGRHPDIASTPESQFIAQARFDMKLRPGLSGKDVARQAMATTLIHLVQDEASFASDLEAAFAKDTVSDRVVFATALDHFRKSKNRPRVLEKTPGHLRSMPLLHAWFPGARFVWIIRDGRGCISSLKKVDWATHDTGALSRQWVRNINFGQAGWNKVGDALVQIRYEDLLTDPRGTMAVVCDHLDLTLDDRMFDHQQQVTTIKSNETSWKQNVLRPLMSDRADAWRRELSQQEIDHATRVMLPMLQRTGYEPEGKQVTLGPRLLDAGMRISVVRAIMRSSLYRFRRLTGSKPAFKRRIKSLLRR